MALSSTDYGRDLAGVQALQRKHEALERDLAALEEKVLYFLQCGFLQVYRDGPLYALRNAMI